MYPPDGLCNYLFYTHVIVFNKTELAGVEVNTSWTLFKKQIAARTKTAGGASFDAKYVTAQAFDDQGLKKHLAKLASANVKNYGILNMVTSVKNWDDFMNRARGTIAKLKAIQGNDSKRKIVMAIGLFDYNEPNAWDKYRKGFQDAVESTMADTVIAISSMSMVETSETCYAAPSSVLDSSRLQDPARTIAKSYPDLVSATFAVFVTPVFAKRGEAYVAVAISRNIFGRVFCSPCHVAKLRKIAMGTLSTPPAPGRRVRCRGELASEYGNFTKSVFGPRGGRSRQRQPVSRAQ
ncbi:hypothetical protein MRX96_031869 [Rhipicephalus microplus]